MLQWVWPVWWIGSYLCGSISFALLLGRLRGIDVRKVGSGNVGATNVGRVLGRKWGAMCFVLDVLKGFAPVFLAGQILIDAPLGVAGALDLSPLDAWRWLGVGVAAVLGHVFPVWLTFKGGKGVATSFGVLLGFWPVMTVPALGALLTWLVTAAAFRYVGLASIAAALALPLFIFLWARLRFDQPPWLAAFVTATAALALLVLIRHRGNVARMLAGTEPKIGQKKAA